MKILITTTEYGEIKWGGLGSYVDILVNGLIESGHEVIVWLIENADHKKIFIRDEKCKVIKTSSNIFYSEQAILELYDQQIKNVDYIHDNNIYFTYPLIKVLSKKREVKYILTFHSFEWQHFLKGNHVEAALVSRLVMENSAKLSQYNPNMVHTFRIEREMIFNCSRIILPGENMQEYLMYVHYDLQSFIKEKSIVINHGIDTGLYFKDYSIHQKEKIRQKYAFKDEILMVFSGRLHPQKGLEYLLPALEIVMKNEECKPRLGIAGKGDLGFYINRSQNIASVVSYYGFLSHQDMIDLYNVSDFGVMPSLFEPFGYSCIEMMASGLPVITTDKDGPGEIIVNGITGYKVSVIEDIKGERTVDIESLAQSILTLVRDQKLRKKMSNCALENVREKYTFERFLKSTIGLYV